jgi:preprotein translocase subunit SecE
VADKNEPKKPNPIAKWWRETVGELRKVTWPTTHDAWRLTKIVIFTMVVMSAILGILDFVFSRLVGLIFA